MVCGAALVIGADTGQRIMPVQYKRIARPLKAGTPTNKVVFALVGVLTKGVRKIRISLNFPPNGRGAAGCEMAGRGYSQILNAR